MPKISIKNSRNLFLSGTPPQFPQSAIFPFAGLGDRDRFPRQTVAPVAFNSRFWLVDRYESARFLNRDRSNGHNGILCPRHQPRGDFMGPTCELSVRRPLKGSVRQETHPQAASELGVVRLVF
jgi:hypothetical protein